MRLSKTLVKLQQVFAFLFLPFNLFYPIANCHFVQVDP